MKRFKLKLLPGIHKDYRWYYRIVTPPQNGVAFINQETGVITYTPNPNFVGTDSVVVSVTNSAGVTSTATITFIVQRGISFRCSIIF
ncbi:cadherin-like domain-containing protein [Priestia flexa]|nr:cadherin-like domain-containing protein [Priestia flexa]